MTAVTGPARTGSTTTLARTLTVVVIGSVMAVLDVTIVNVAIHPLATAFHTPLATVQWVATGYTLALCAVIPLAAWAMGRFGAKRTYLTALALFTGGSAAASLSWNVEALVLWRVVQGLGGGLLMPVGMAMVIRTADRDHLGRAMALLGIPVLIGPVSGPILGGWLLDTASWHWLFLINLPIGIVALTLAIRLLHDDEARQARRLDVPGLLMLSPGLALLIYGLSTGGTHSDFTGIDTLLPTAAGLALMAIFVVRGLTSNEPLLRLRLFRHRTFAAGIATMTLFPAGYFGSMLLTPMYYQTARGLTATESGLLMAPLAFAVGTSMQIATRRIDRISPRLTIASGIVVAALGLSLFDLQLGSHTAYWRMCTALILMGIGVGMVMMPVNATATRMLAPDDVPSASTMINIVAQIGASIGTALVSVILTRNTTSSDQTTAFQHTYWWPATLMALAVIPALFLPHERRSPSPSTTPHRPSPQGPTKAPTR